MIFFIPILLEKVITLKEQYLYGSKRLGVRKPNVQLAAAPHTAVGCCTAPILNFEFAILNCSPFGSLMPGRTYVAPANPAYRFGFNGMQRDDELKGPGNALDFGARMYDSRLGRWMSVDQLAGKYPNLSPFNFTANNPVLYVDFDGRDYHVHVNHSSKTIIVRATVYVTEGNSQEQASAMMAADFWNGQSCNFQYNINSDGKMQSYDIKFELTVKEHNSPEEAAYEDESGNSYLLRPDDWVEFSKNDRGFTEKGQFIFIKGSRKDSDTGTHELGHTLGLDHWELGIMTEGVKGLDRVNQITAEQVSQILNMAIPELNAGVYTPNGSNSSGSVVPVNANSSTDNSSLTPSNFNNGRVSAVRDN